MKYDLIVPGMEYTKIVVETLKRKRFIVWVDGYQAERMAKDKNIFKVRHYDGTTSILEIRTTDFGLTIKCDIASQLITITPHIAWYYYILTFLPLALIFIGGLIGGVVGFIVMGINAKVLTSKLNGFIKVLLSLGAIVLAYVLYFIVSGLFLLASSQ